MIFRCDQDVSFRHICILIFHIVSFETNFNDLRASCAFFLKCIKYTFLNFLCKKFTRKLGFCRKFFTFP